MNNMNFGGAIDYSQLMGNMPGVQFLNIDDIEPARFQSGRRVKKKKDRRGGNAAR